MANFAKNPIKEHRIGLPCMLGEVVGRIIGEADEGSWAKTHDGKDAYSIPIFCTPGGTVIKVGQFYLDEITEVGLSKLEAYEEEMRADNKEMYSGKYLISIEKNVNT